MSKPTTYTQLVRATSALMRRKGYAGVGLTEILTEAKLPKGSLYYHFPGGKPELAAWICDVGLESGVHQQTGQALSTRPTRGASGSRPSASTTCSPLTQTP